MNRLEIVPVTQGDVLRGIRTGDSGYRGFGEAYFSTVGCGAVKAWKKHREMTLNLVVPAGRILFVIHDRRTGSGTFGEFREEQLSRDRYCRLTIGPGLWFGFQGLGAGENIVLNVADREHDPAEVDRAPVEEFEYEWKK